MTKAPRQYDYAIIGGGFYGCCLALYLRSLSSRVVVLEANDKLLNRASRVNQARIHSGFHYPRSVLTAVKSKVYLYNKLYCFGSNIIERPLKKKILPAIMPKILLIIFYLIYLKRLK